MKTIGIIGGILCGFIALCIIVVTIGCACALLGAYDKENLK